MVPDRIITDVKSYRYDPNTRVLCIKVWIRPVNEFYEHVPKPTGAQAIINAQVIKSYRTGLSHWLKIGVTVLYYEELIHYGSWDFISARISGDYIIIQIQGTETSKIPSEMMVEEVAMYPDDEDIPFDFPLYASDARRVLDLPRRYGYINWPHKK